MFSTPVKWGAESEAPTNFPRETWDHDCVLETEVLSARCSYTMFLQDCNLPVGYKIFPI